MPANSRWDLIQGSVKTVSYFVLSCTRNITANAVHCRQHLRQYRIAYSLNVMLQAFPSVIVVFSSQELILFEAFFFHIPQTLVQKLLAVRDYTIFALSSCLFVCLFVCHSPLVINLHLIPFRICQL